MNRPIVVGVADSGAAAVEWAAGEALLRHRPLRIVHILEWNATEANESAGSTYVERVWASSTAMTYAATERARAAAPGLEVKADTLVGHPATCLLELARGTDLMVVGFRGRGGFAGLRLGTVGQRVATHAACPVVVVRDRPHPGGPVVAGVDDSPAADHVLDAAFAAAAARATRLVVLHGHARTPGGPAPELEERLVPWRGKFPDVPVEVLVTHDSAATALIAASAGAQLVVVGSRGRGPIRGALLGSTGLQLLHHAECPVLVTRS